MCRTSLTVVLALSFIAATASAAPWTPTAPADDASGVVATYSGTTGTPSDEAPDSHGKMTDRSWFNLPAVVDGVRIQSDNDRVVYKPTTALDRNTVVTVGGSSDWAFSIDINQTSTFDPAGWKNRYFSINGGHVVGEHVDVIEMYALPTVENTFQLRTGDGWSSEYVYPGWHTWQVYFDASAGTYQVSVDDTVLLAAANPIDAGASTAIQLIIGQNWDHYGSTWEGDNVYLAEIREPELCEPGDADGDGDVDDDDLSLLLANWGGDVDCTQGEFSGVAPVNDDDLSLLLANWTGSLPAAVPEPTAMAILAAGALILSRRKK